LGTHTLPFTDATNEAGRHFDHFLSGDKIVVNQNDKKFHFAVHLDSDADTV
jgi:hypothetical protein